MLTIGVGLPVNVVSDYLPDEITDFQMAWITGLVVVTFAAVWLTWLAPWLAERRVRGRLFQVPAMPSAWVARDELDATVQALTSAAGGTVGVTTVLWGAGGFGKTSLAVAACHDRRVRRFFSDGIVWATIGRDRAAAEGAELIRSLCETLSGESPQMTDAGQLAHHLAELMAERRRMLLVVDDVWTSAQLEPFLVVARRSRLLVTTRRPRTLPVGVTKVEVDAMAPAVASRLLGRDLPLMRADVRRRLLEVTGGWPLLLALVNARLVEDVSRNAQVDAAAEQAVARLRRAGPSALDIADSGQRETAVKATINYSVEALAPEMRGRFLELGIFGEDVDVPLEMVALLWRGTAGLSVEQSQRLCEDLAGLSLLTLRWVGGRHRVVALHDVVRSFARSELAVDPNRLVEANRSLISEARSLVPATERSEWWRLSPGHFLWDQLAYHLTEEDCRPELDRLVTDIYWILARLEYAGPLALEADLKHSTSAEAVEICRLIAQVGYLLGGLETKELSEGNRLTHLSALPHLRSQIERLLPATGPVLLPKLLMPESRDSAPVRTLAGHTGEVQQVAIAPGGTWLASASADRTVRLWNLDGSERAVLAGHTGEVQQVAIAPDGTWLASASADRTVRLWNLDGSERAVLTGHTGEVFDVVIAPDGTWLATASFDETVRLWSVDGSECTVLTGHTGGVTAAAIAPNGTWLASASADRTVRLWNVDGSERAVLTGHTGVVYGVAIAPDGTWLASASADRTVRLWNVDGSERAVLTGHTGEVYGVAIAPDGTWLASASASGDRTVRLWESDGSERAVLTGHTGEVFDVVIAPDGTWLATTSDDRTVRLWNVDHSKHAIWACHTEEVYGVAIAPDGTWLATASYDETVRLWNLDGSERAILTGHTGAVYAVAIATDGTWLATTSFDQTVRLWNVDGSERAILTGHSDEVYGVAIAPDGTWLATASYDETVRLWNVDGSERAILTGHTEVVYGVAIAPDGTWLATASYDETVRLWNLDGSERAILTGHTDAVKAVAIAPDGTWLATGSSDGTVRLWNVDGSERAILAGHTDAVNAVAIAPDGTWLATGSSDGTVRIWHLNCNGNCAAVLRSSATINDVYWQAGGLIAACGASGFYTFALTVNSHSPA
ncbi:NB-ARC domain-containing protein [Nonomuraea sp. NPDC002799]